MSTVGVIFNDPSYFLLFLELRSTVPSGSLRDPAQGQSRQRTARYFSSNIFRLAFVAISPMRLFSGERLALPYFWERERSACPPNKTASFVALVVSSLRLASPGVASRRVRTFGPLRCACLSAATPLSTAVMQWRMHELFNCVLVDPLITCLARFALWLLATLLKIKLGSQGISVTPRPLESLVLTWSKSLSWFNLM